MLFQYSLSKECDAKWRQRSWPAVAHVMAYCLTALSNYLSQCWLIINGVLRCSSKTIFTGGVLDIISQNSLKYISLTFLPHVSGAKSINRTKPQASFYFHILIMHRVIRLNNINWISLIISYLWHSYQTDSFTTYVKAVFSTTRYS